MAKPVVIVDSGSGNLRSVARALENVGARAEISGDPTRIRNAERVMVPGQGAFASCMNALRSSGGDDALREFVASGRPYFGICLGLQVLFDESSEHGVHAGLGIVPGRVDKLPESKVRVPHIGWNDVAATRSDPVLVDLDDPTYFYFVHSYRVLPERLDDIALTCHYGDEFTAAIRTDNIFACQFHPEKSQSAGLKLLSNFVRSC